MRWTVALLAALLLSGCSSKAPSSTPDVGIAASDLAPGNHTQTEFPLKFAGGTREAEMGISETFAPTDACLLGFPQCVGAGERTYDLTPLLPADVPVELAITLTANANLRIDWAMADAQFVRINEDGDSGGVTRIDATLVRTASGTVAMEVTYRFPSPDSAQSVTLEGNVHTVTRDDVLPPLLPVAVELGPGDVVNATGDGLEQFVAFPPTGVPLRAVQSPFSLAIPADAPRGTWYLMGEADEAMRVTGPNRTLSARLLEFAQTTPVPVPANQVTTFPMDVAGHPLLVGVVVQSVDSVNGFFGTAEVLGAHTVALASPDNVQVLEHGNDNADCVPWCTFNPIGSFEFTYASPFLEEHLVAGTFTATIDMTTANNVQAYGWSLSIKTT